MIIFFNLSGICVSLRVKCQTLCHLVNKISTVAKRERKKTRHNQRVKRRRKKNIDKTVPKLLSIPYNLGTSYFDDHASLKVEMVISIHQPVSETFWWQIKNSKRETIFHTNLYQAHGWLVFSGIFNDLCIFLPSSNSYYLIMQKCHKI